MQPNKERQRAFRARQAERLSNAARMETALRMIAERLEGRTGPVAVEIREIAAQAVRQD